MEKSKLKVGPHLISSLENAIEVWHGGKMIATVYGTDGPGVRVISKYPMDVVRGGLGPTIRAIEVRIEPI